jgi:hypothetical protein
MPLAGRCKSFERDEQTWWFFPTFQYGWTPNSRFFNIHPLFYRKKSPDKTHLALVPLYLDFVNRPAKTRRLVLSLLYWGFDNDDKQNYSRVFFPLYWEFQNGRKTTDRRVGFPFYWSFSVRALKKDTLVVFPFFTRWTRDDVERQVVLNTYYEKKKEPEGVRWRFHFFPFFSRGGMGEDRWWKVMGGLAGSDRRGVHRQIQVLWLPFQLR